MRKIYDLTEIITEITKSFHSLKYDFIDVRFHDTADPIIEMEIWEKEVSAIWERLIKYAAHKNKDIFYQYQTKDIEVEKHFLFIRKDSPLLNLWINDFTAVIKDHVDTYPEQKLLFETVLKIVEEFTTWQSFSFEQPHHAKPTSSLPEA